MGGYMEFDAMTEDTLKAAMLKADAMSPQPDWVCSVLILAIVASFFLVTCIVITMHRDEGHESDRKMDILKTVVFVSIFALSVIYLVHHLDTLQGIAVQAYDDYMIGYHAMYDPFSASDEMIENMAKELTSWR